MSLTALAWAAIYCLTIVGAFFVNPLFAAIGYLHEYYQRPELKWWGDDLPALRYNLIISLTLGVTFIMHRSSLRELAPVPNMPLRWLIALACVMIAVSLTFAVNMTVSLDWTNQWVKMAIIFPMLVVGVVRTRMGFNLFVVAHMLGAFYWGWESWLDPEREQSRLLNVGSGDTLNDNAASTHLMTVLPFAIVYFLTEKNKWLRAVGLITAPFVVNTLILCNSRGAMVGMAVALGSSLFLVRSGYRLRIIGAAIAMVVSLFFLADEQFIERQQSTQNYEQDGSAQQRLITWQGGMKLVRDRPWGTGGRGFHMLSPIYIPEIVAAHDGDLRAPHNTYVMVATEWGVVGLVCFVGVFASTFGLLRRIKQHAVEDGRDFYYWRAFAIQVGLIAYLVAASFTDRLYGEAGYWMIALAFAMYRMQLTERAEAAGVPVSAPAPAAAASTMPHRPAASVPAGAYSR